jgi:hypothetical protein|nr:MAG TPA: hypothetical protein [Caudoviricetes sp.]
MSKIDKIENPYIETLIKTIQNPELNKFKEEPSPFKALLNMEVEDEMFGLGQIVKVYTPFYCSRDENGNPSKAHLEVLFDSQLGVVNPYIFVYDISTNSIVDFYIQGEVTSLNQVLDTKSKDTLFLKSNLKITGRERHPNDIYIGRYCVFSIENSKGLVIDKLTKIESERNEGVFVADSYITESGSSYPRLIHTLNCEELKILELREDKKRKPMLF